MTRQETGIIMDVLTTAYPRFYAGKIAPDMRQTMNLWAEMFAEDDVTVVAAAVKALIATDDEGFPPHIGAVKARIRKITQPQAMTPAEARSLVAKAVRNSLYESQEEFDRLPSDIRSLVGSPNQLRDWAMMDSETLHSVVASNFQKSYTMRKTQEREYQALPSDVKSMIGGLAERMELHD